MSFTYQLLFRNKCAVETVDNFTQTLPGYYPGVQAHLRGRETTSLVMRKKGSRGEAGPPGTKGETGFCVCDQSEVDRKITIY